MATALAEKSSGDLRDKTSRNTCLDKALKGGMIGALGGLALSCAIGIYTGASIDKPAYEQVVTGVGYGLASTRPAIMLGIGTGMAAGGACYAMKQKLHRA